ncbi:MAG: type II secretion system protein [Firmicutes bacterium]|nr:type II secretion system protein [Bacillota bacterium]
MNKITENKNSGFSLVELIVVIAIMAVLTSVLAPSLLSYVEKSRMQKDDSAMGEVANSIKLALADQNVYDECLTYNVAKNYSCYADSTISKFEEGKATQDKNRATDETKAELTDDWHYNDTTRLKDEEAYHPDGNMRGMTITFYATPGANTATFSMKAARINDMPGTNTNKCKAPLDYSKKTIDTAAKTTLGEMTTAGGQKGQLYNKLRAQIGDNITLSSQTYRNSDYTVFIRMGSLGGNDASAQDAVAVYGQWSGTNLPATTPTTTP